MTTGSQIDVVLDDLRNHFKTTKDSEQKLRVELENIIRKVYVDSINQNKGYCITFKNVESDVLNLYNILGLDQHKVSNAFVSDWLMPPTAHMGNNPYYHILLLITIYALHQKNIKLANDAMAIYMFKTWNGRKKRFIQYCDVNTMRYVIANLSGKFYARNYDSPLIMITDKFAPTLIEKYKDQILRDSKQSKRLFDQTFVRIRQLFVQNMKPNLLSGKTEAQGGIAALYHAAKKKGYSISSPKVLSNSDDSSMSSLEMYTSDSYEETINAITTYIIVNHHPTYSPQFINYVSVVSKNGIKPQIEILLKSIHNIRYQEYIKEILSLMIKQLPIFEKTELCSPKIYETVKQKIISSKHSPNVTQIKQIADLLLAEIFKNTIKNVSFNEYSPPVRGKCRAIIFLGFAYNIQNYLCRK